VLHKHIKGDWYWHNVKAVGWWRRYKFRLPIPSINNKYIISAQAGIQ
jgi:hypothetical protein